MFCTKCGQQVADGAQFCTSCGASLGGAPSEGGSAPGSVPRRTHVRTEETVTVQPQVQSVDASVAAEPKKKQSLLAKVIEGIGTVVIILIVIGLLNNAGVFGHDDRFVGTWTTTIEQQHDDGLTYKDTYTLQVQNDGTWVFAVQINGRIIGTDYGTTRQSGTWSSSGDTITCKITSPDPQNLGFDTYKFNLSSNGNTLSDSSITLKKTSASASA